MWRGRSLVTSTRTSLYYGYFRTSAVKRIFQRRLQNNVEGQDLGAGPYYGRCAWWRKQEVGTLTAASSIPDWPSQDCAPAVLLTANVGKRSSIDFRKTVPHLVYYCPDKRTRRFNVTNTKLPLNTILSQFHLISVLITCLAETRSNVLSPFTHLLLRYSADHFVTLHPVKATNSSPKLSEWLWDQLDFLFEGCCG